MATFATADAATAAIEAHPLCVSFTETPTRYAVFYPAAYKIPGGASVMRGTDDLTALTVLFNRMEDFWNQQRLKVSK